MAEIIQIGVTLGFADLQDVRDALGKIEEIESITTEVSDPIFDLIVYTGSTTDIDELINKIREISNFVNAYRV